MEGDANWIIKEVQEDLLRQVDAAPGARVGVVVNAGAARLLVD